MDFRTDHPQEIVKLLSLRGEQAEALRQEARKVRLRELSNKVYLRGLIEFSNICTKDCLYCGIRKSNPCVHRYTLTPEEVLQVRISPIRRASGLSCCNRENAATKLL